MRFLDRNRVLSNMRVAARHLAGREFSGRDLKIAFIEGMNRAQSSTLRTYPDKVYIEFDNPELTELLVRKTIFSPEDVQDNKHLCAPDEQKEIRHKIEAAQALIRDIDPGLQRLIETLIGTVAVYRIPDRDGGTVSCCIGLIWLSPREDWTLNYYAEMLVHEFVHNSVFLEDMVRGIMPNLDLLNREDAQVTSVIRKSKRDFDKAYHSACVGATLMYLYHLLGQDSVVDEYVPPMERTLAELEAIDRNLRIQGLNILTDNGRVLLGELRRFAEHSDYHFIANEIRS